MSSEKLQIGSIGYFPRASALEGIADILGIPVETFTDGSPAPRELRDTCELLELWTAIQDDHDRQRLLTFARALV